MLANQNLMIEAMQMSHNNTVSVLELLSKTCEKMGVSDVGSECQQVRDSMKDMESMFTTLRDASTADLSQVLEDVKKFATDSVSKESRELQAELKKGVDAASGDMSDKFKKLESRVLAEIATSGGGDGDGASGGKRPGDAQVLKKVASRMSDFESQVSSQLQVMSADIEKKLAFVSSQKGGGGGGDGSGPGSDSLAHDLDAVKYDIGELKDMVNGTKNDTAQVKRIVLACERDMEDFTAAMDAVNVDLDEMRARVDSTHSIITSRQRVEATVTAEISTMRLDMGDMQEALKAHDAWMEDVSQSLQEAHERCHQLGEDLAGLADSTQSKLDEKVDIPSWTDMNDDIKESVKTVRDMTSALRLEVDTRRRKVDESLNQIRGDAKALDEKVDAGNDNLQKQVDSASAQNDARFQDVSDKHRAMDARAARQEEVQQEAANKIDANMQETESMMSKVKAELVEQDEELNKQSQDRMDSLERHYSNVAKETSKRMNALDLRISGLQGTSGELKRDSSKLRDEVNNLTVKSAAHDVDIGKNSDDLRKVERQRAEDVQRHKQDMDGVYEELDQKVYEKNFKALEDLTTKLTRGTVKLCQVVGVFPGARMNDGTEEELDVDVELLNWEDCAQHLVARVEKTWRQQSSQKYRSILDLVSKKADHSVLRLLQISQQHIESQLDRVRHERELWKEVVDKRAQQPLQLALSLKDPSTGQPLPGGMGSPMNPMLGGYTPRFHDGDLPPVQMGPGGPPMGGMDGGMMKASPLAKRIARPAGTPPQKA